MTTWRLESMWTRTLSTTISISPSSMRRLSHGRWGDRPATAEPADDQPDERPEHEPADVGEERDPAADVGHAQRRDAIDELVHEPEHQHDHCGDVDELVEEPEEDERGDARPREQDEIGPERRRDGARGADGRDGRLRVDQDLGEA